MRVAERGRPRGLASADICDWLEEPVRNRDGFLTGYGFQEWEGGGDGEEVEGGGRD